MKSASHTATTKREVYLLAAELLDDLRHSFCCIAIGSSAKALGVSDTAGDTSPDNKPFVGPFKDVFYPGSDAQAAVNRGEGHHDQNSSYWLTGGQNRDGSWTPDPREARIIALLLLRGMLKPKRRPKSRTRKRRLS